MLNFILPAEAGTAFVVLALILIISITVPIIFFIRKKSDKNQESYDKSDVGNIQNRVSDISSALHNLPRSQEVELLEDKVRALENDFSNLSEDIKKSTENQNELINTKTKEQAEQIENTKKILLQDIRKEILKNAENYIVETSVNRESFESLKSRIDNLIGAEIDAQRLWNLEQIFGKSSKKSVISWQCKLIKILKGGLAPKAEENVLASESITVDRATKFLKHLTELGIVNHKRIDAYYLKPEFEWLHKYVDDVELLTHRIEQSARNEKKYEEYLKENISLIESGLILQQTQYHLSPNHIVDMLFVDSRGEKLFIELKYPTASFRDRTQIKDYHDTYTGQPGAPKARFMLVAPTISKDIQTLLSEDGLEFKEIPHTIESLKD